MEVNRRSFLKIAGLATAGLMVKPAVDVLSKVQPVEASSEANISGSGRWAMAINTKTCLANDGCTDCIKACHLTHNVPDFPNAKDDIKWMWAASYEHAFEEHDNMFIKEELKHAPILMLCNHCDKPACVQVCPTQATWKREDGIVMMDYHRCIGCRFCMAACPYGSRSFNWRDPRPYIKETNPDFPTRMRGVVEKCNFCAERLAKGLAPACVDACKEKALVFGDLEDPNSEIRDVLNSNYTIRRKAGVGTSPQIYYLV